MLTTQRHSRSRFWTLGLALVLVGFLAPLSVAQGPTTLAQQPSGSSADYDIALWAPHTAVQGRSTELVVRVRNAQGRVANGVPVQFEVDTTDGNASVVPQRAITHNGVARASFQSSLIGVVNVMAHVGGSTETASIAVSSDNSTGNPY